MSIFSSFLTFFSRTPNNKPKATELDDDEIKETKEYVTTCREISFVKKLQREFANSSYTSSRVSFKREIIVGGNKNTRQRESPRVWRVQVKPSEPPKKLIEDGKHILYIVWATWLGPTYHHALYISIRGHQFTTCFEHVRKISHNLLGLQIPLANCPNPRKRIRS